jgi:hypothetical protein
MDRGNIATGPDGALWYLGQVSKIGRMTTDGTRTTYRAHLDIQNEDPSMTVVPWRTSLATARLPAAKRCRDHLYGGGGAVGQV